MPATYEKIVNLRENHILTNQAGEKYIDFEQLQKLAGIIVHCSRTCPTGLVKAHGILKNLAEGHENPERLVKLDEKTITEIDFWCTENQIMKMRKLKTTGSAVFIVENDPARIIKRQKLEHCSDASGDYWCVKVNGIY